jgi:hypothetical protein
MDLDEKSCVYLQKLDSILDYKVPKSQRPLDINHVQKMVRDQVEEYKRYKSYSILQAITVVNINNELIYIIDGQHRIQAFKELEKLGYHVKNIVVPVVCYRVVDETEMLKYFNMINSNMPIHPLELQEDFADYGKILIENITKTFDVYVKNDNKNSLCPHINMNEFKKNLSGRNLSDKLRNHSKSIDDFWNKILEFNEYVQNHVKAPHQLCATMKKRIESCENKAQKFKVNMICYLGVWRKFEWLDFSLTSLLENKEFHEISLACEKNTRMIIPYIIREQVWKKCNTNTSDLGICFTCCNDLYFRDMECGHIKAHALGGDITLDNLMPVCKTCNKDMGIMDLFEYKLMIEKMNR